MKEAKSFLCYFIKAVPVGAGCLKEVEGADDVGLDELGRSMDRAIHMGLGGKIDDGTGSVLGEQFGNEFGIPYVTAHEGMPWITINGDKVLQIAGVGQLIEINDGILPERDPIENKVGTNESGAAGDEDGGHHEKAFRQKTVSLLGIKLSLVGLNRIFRSRRRSRPQRLSVRRWAGCRSRRAR